MAAFLPQLPPSSSSQIFNLYEPVLWEEDEEDTHNLDQISVDSQVQHQNPRQRTLDKFPMKYSRADLNYRLEARRMGQQRHQVHLHKANNASSNLYRYGKRLFEDTLVKSQAGSLSSSMSSGSDTSSSGVSRNSSSSLPTIDYAARDRKSELPSYAVLNHSGPSLHGSVLYNKKASLMNSIRMRSNSEPPAPLLRAMSAHTNIAYTLKQSNSTYKVMSPTGTPSGSVGSLYSCPPPNLYSDYILLPATSAPAQQRIIHRAFEVELKKAPSTIPISEVKEGPEDTLPVPTVNVMITCTDEEQEEKTQEKLDDKESVNSKQSKASSAASRSSVKSNQSRSASRSSRRRKCWVDDATVTSDPHPSQASSHGSQHSKRSHQPDKPLETKPDNKQEEQEHVVENTEQQDIKVLSLNELEEGEVELPLYICPSSEEKSKQARIREWLEKTTFTWANRNVPLL